MKLIVFIQRVVLKLLLALPASWKLKLTGGHPIIVFGRELDLDLQVLCYLAKFNPRLDTYPPKKARKTFIRSIGIISKIPISVPKVETTVIGGIHDAIKIRIYNPDPSRDNHPILIYLHGGGFVVGNLDTADQNCRYLAYHTPCMVFSIDYRLAPEHPFPTPIEDGYRAYLWVKNNAFRLGGNPNSMSIAGDSAGANLSIAIAMKLKENKMPSPNFLGLIYPVVDCSKEAPSYETFQEGFLLERNSMRWYLNHYFQDKSQRSDPYASPILAKDLSYFPPTYLSTAGFDVLSDEGKDFVKKLRDEGVRVVHSDFPSLVHGYANIGEMIPSCKNAVDDFVKFLKTEWSILKDLDS